jgi:hypothetical protein
MAIIAGLSMAMPRLALPRPNLPGLRSGPSHPVTDKRVEHFAASG